MTDPPSSSPNSATPHALSYATAVRVDREGRWLRQLARAHYILALVLLVQEPIVFVSAYVLVSWTNHTPIRLSEFLRGTSRMKDGLIQASEVTAVFAALSALSGWLITRRRLRIVSIGIGFGLCLLLPLGIFVGLPTAILLMRKNYRNCYDRAGKEELRSDR